MCQKLNRVSKRPSIAEKKRWDQAFREKAAERELLFWAPAQVSGQTPFLVIEAHNSHDSLWYWHTAVPLKRTKATYVPTSVE